MNDAVKLPRRFGFEVDKRNETFRKEFEACTGSCIRAESSSMFEMSERIYELVAGGAGLQDLQVQ